MLTPFPRPPRRPWSLLPAAASPHAEPAIPYLFHAILQANLAKIAAHNARNDQTFQLGLNAHADLTAEEFRLRYFGHK